MRILVRFPPTRFVLMLLADHDLLRRRIEEALRADLVRRRARAGSRKPIMDAASKEDLADGRRPNGRHRRPAAHGRPARGDEAEA